MKGGINFEEWKEIVKKNRRSLRSKSNIFRFEPESLTYGAEKAVKSPEYGQIHTITYNVAGVDTPSSWPTDIKSGKTLSLSIPEGYEMVELGIDGTTLDDYKYENGVITVNNVQHDLAITLTVSPPVNANGHEYVDLGLPSGTLWATMNVGASSEKDAGLYFAWGETQGYAASQVGTGEGQKAFSWSDYALTEDSGSTMSKYNASDNKTNLELTDDAAHVNWGGDWHMPNRAQCIELFKETKNGFVTNAGAFTQYAWDDNNGYSRPTSTTATISNWDTAGYFFFKNSYTSVTDAISAEDYLFVPAAGSCGDGKVVNVGNYGGVWASALYSEGVEGAWNFYFNSGRAGVDGSYRFSGQSVRGVVGQ